MSFFQGSSHFTIEGGTLSSIGRDQVNITQCSHRDDRVWTILDEYQRIPTGKVYLKQQITKTDVKICYKREWRNVDACRIIHIARIRGEDKDEEFLHVQYSGRDASKAFQLDFDTFSAIKDNDSLQLFGYSNMNLLPTLVFYDALVPVSHIWERNNFSPLLFTYFCYQAVAVQGFDSATWSQELWHDPKTGFLRKGPFVQHSSNINYRLINLAHALPDRGRSSLTLSTYNNTNVLFEYLNGMLSISDIIRGVRRSNKVFLDYPNEDAKWILSSLPGTIYHRASREVVAQYPEGRGIWYYGFLERIFTIPDALQGSMFTMDSGSVRFTLKPSDMGDLELFELYYAMQPWDTWDDFMDSWLSQAHGIYSQLGIGEDEWDEYCTILGFRLNFKRVGEHERSHTYMDLPEEIPIYLFVRPIPRTCNDEDRWDPWLRDVKYYWSLDSSGVNEMSEHERLNLGLPAFMTRISVDHQRWDREAYDVLKMIHRSRGFDPTSTELATSLGNTILEVAGRKSRFEEVDNDDCLSNSDLGEYTTADESVCEDSHAANGDTDDDEVVLYPRLNSCRSMAGR